MKARRCIRNQTKSVKAYASAIVIPTKVGIQMPSLRKQGTIKNWIPVFTGNPGFLLEFIPMKIGAGMTF